MVGKVESLTVLILAEVCFLFVVFQPHFCPPSTDVENPSQKDLFT